ncbi:MAG: TIM barrel protein [Rubripirellula sp.]|jgi:sugar phosphate isomerase/epimerase|nr:TIM barrel protein [Rubripirellula sp.]
MKLMKLSSVVVWAVLMVMPVFADQPGSPTIVTPAFAPAFYAFENGVRFGSPEKDARVLRELGYAGISQVQASGDKLASQVAAFEKAGLKVLSVYLNVGETPLAQDLVKPLANRDALIEITIRKLSPKTVQAVRETAEMASQLNIRVAIYPHHGNAIATMPQAMELIRTVAHPNLGVMFNLCHFLKNERSEDLELVLENAGSRLFAVSTCGANLGGEDWGQLIKPLNQGDFPQARLMQTLKKLGFKGPVGLQCYAVPGDKQQNLTDSMTAWKKILSEL